MVTSRKYEIRTTYIMIRICYDKKIGFGKVVGSKSKESREDGISSGWMEFVPLSFLVYTTDPRGLHRGTRLLWRIHVVRHSTALHEEGGGATAAIRQAKVTVARAPY